MAQIGTLLTGAGVVTSFSGLSQADEFILIGDVDTANPLQGISVDLNGETIINITNQALISAYAKWLQESAAGPVGGAIKVGTGRMKGNTTIRLTNSGATTPAVFAWSDSDGGRPMIAATSVILAGGYSDYSDFSALFITAPANLQQAVVTFSDGFQTIMTAPEIGAYLNITHQTDADGYLAGCPTFDNSQGNIKAVRIFATGANLNVLQVKIPE
jgi:hypothetical protein